MGVLAPPAPSLAEMRRQIWTELARLGLPEKWLANATHRTPAYVRAIGRQKITGCRPFFVAAARALKIALS